MMLDLYISFTSRNLPLLLLSATAETVMIVCRINRHIDLTLPATGLPCRYCTGISISAGKPKRHPVVSHQLFTLCLPSLGRTPNVERLYVS